MNTATKFDNFVEKHLSIVLKPTTSIMLHAVTNFSY